MTITISTPVSGPYLADGSVTSFTRGFYISDGDQVAVYQEADGVKSLVSSGYSHTGVGFNSGAVVFDTAPADGVTITLIRETPIEQQTDYNAQGKVTPQSVEDDLDLANMRIQDTAERVSRAVLVDVGSAAPSFDAVTDERVLMLRDGAIVDGPIGTELAEATAGLLTVAGYVAEAADYVDDAAAYAGYRHYKTVALLVASDLDYTTASEGDLVHVRDGDYKYQVAASGASDQHLTTAGGAKLYAKPGDDLGVYPDMFGDDLTAMETARDYALANGVPVILASRDYDIGTASSFDFQGCMVRAEKGASITGYVLVYGATAPTVQGELAINYDDGSVTLTHSFTESHARPWSQKSLFLGEGDIDRTEYESVDAINMTHATIAWPSSDTWAASVLPTGDASQISWPTTTDATWRASFAPMRGGQELNCVFGAGEYQRAAIIRSSLGYHIVYASTAAGAGTLGVKLTGVALSSNAFDWLGRSDHLSMEPGNSMWTIRLIDHRTWEVLLNGMSVTGHQDIGDGIIYDAGFGSYGDATVAVVIEQVTKTDRSLAGGAAPSRLLIVGDSISAPIQGDWPTQMREMMDGTYGLKLLGVTNVAFAGANSADMVATITSGGTYSSNYALVLIGTNDIQGGSSAETTLGNLGYVDGDGGLLSLLRTAYCEPIVAIPPLWYNQTLSGGTGGATTNYENGARTRAAIIRLCALRGIKCVDLQQVLGPVLANYLSVTDMDPVVRDNAHLTQAGNRNLAVAFSRALADVAFPKMTPLVAPRALPDLWANSWTSSTTLFSVDAAGRVHLSGLATAGTKADGTTIYTLPVNLRPSLNLSFATITDVGSETARVDVNADGTVKIYQISTATTVSLGGISWIAA